MNENKKTKSLCVTNIFLFNEKAYREIFVYSTANALSEVTKSWGKTSLLLAALSSPVIFLFSVSFFMSDFSESKNYISVIPLIAWVCLVVCGIYMIRQHGKINWKNSSSQKMLNQDFARVKSGYPLIFNTTLHFLADKFRKKKRQPVYSEEAWSAPNEIEFSARICDDGIYVGKSNKKVLKNYRTDISDTYESFRYYGILCKKGAGNIIFDKAAFEGTDFKRMKEFINAKFHGKDVHLADYIDKEEE